MLAAQIAGGGTPGLLVFLGQRILLAQVACQGRYERADRAEVTAGVATGSLRPEVVNFAEASTASPSRGQSLSCPPGGYVTNHAWWMFAAMIVRPNALNAPIARVPQTGPSGIQTSVHACQKIHAPIGS